MFIVLQQAGYFARQHAQPLLLIALVLSLPGWFIDYALTPAIATPKADTAIQDLGVNLLLTVLAVVQFAAAMIYIHQQVTGRPVGARQAVAMSVSRLGPLLVINALMAMAIGGGLMLLVAPGLFMAYKLMFAEFYLLFHGQRPIQALRSSYKDNTDLAGKLLPPLLLWGGLMATTAIGQQVLLEQGQDPLVINLLFETTAIALTLWGWALMYRLYQIHIEPGVPDTRKDTALSELNQNAEKEPDQ
ncbi:MAG: hypothetical protein ACI9W6_001801 [Motiliproteus sp.]|jgi:hypothetical protein